MVSFGPVGAGTGHFSSCLAHRWKHARKSRKTPHGNTCLGAVFIDSLSALHTLGAFDRCCDLTYLSRKFNIWMKSSCGRLIRYDLPAMAPGRTAR